MRPWAPVSRLIGWLWWAKRSERSSHILVSVYVQARSMSPRGLLRSSRRILLTTSIWSVITLLLIFLIIYTFLVAGVNGPTVRTSSADWSMNSARRKVKFQGKGFSSSNGSSLLFASDSHPRREVWDPVHFDDPASDLPVCKHESLFTIIITSSPDHSQHRKEIRNTWCKIPESSVHIGHAWQCVFLIGQTDDAEMSSKLKQESQSHKDILRGSYLDSYRNLTYKVMHGLAWVSTKCESLYVLKTDDDCFVNTVLLWQFLLHHNSQTTNLYAGSMVIKEEGRIVIRKPNEKWTVSREDYLPEYYPTYASGNGYILSFDVVKRAVKESRYVKPIPNEDAYVGIVMDYLGVPPTFSGRFSLSSSGLHLCNFLYIFVTHGIIPSMHQAMYDKMLAAQTHCKDEDDGNVQF